MKTKAKRRFLLGIHPFALAAITAIISICVLFGLGYPLQSVKWNDIHIGDWIAYIITGIFIACACFFICKEYPKSIWYVPIISNAVGILSAVIEPSFWVTDLWKLNVCVWVLSFPAGTIGALSGKRNAAKV
jgi:hypothetical protein